MSGLTVCASPAPPYRKECRLVRNWIVKCHRSRGRKAASDGSACWTASSRNSFQMRYFDLHELSAYRKFTLPSRMEPNDMAFDKRPLPHNRSALPSAAGVGERQGGLGATRLCYPELASCAAGERVPHPYHWLAHFGAGAGLGSETDRSASNTTCARLPV